MLSVFTLTFLFVFLAAIIITAYFTVSMCCDMQMPGGWTMSMMWMRMPGNTWFTAFLSFTIMWIAMMVGMMMPSALPMFLKIKRSGKAVFLLALGYFTVWTLPVFLLYPLGMVLANAAMQSQRVSRAAPLLFGIILIAVGVYQFTQLKLNYLLHCRPPFNCMVPGSGRFENTFRLGCKNGLECFVCCGGLMIAQLMLGIMNPLAMIFIALAIAAEKMLPRPDITTRLFGLSAIIAGLANIIHWAMVSY